MMWLLEKIKAVALRNQEQAPLIILEVALASCVILGSALVAHSSIAAIMPIKSLF